MKAAITLLILSCFIQVVSAVSAQQTCVPDDERLAANDLSTAVNPLYLWWDGSGSEFLYESDTTLKVVFNAGIWLSAQDEAGNVRFASTKYGAPDGQFDF